MSAVRVAVGGQSVVKVSLGCIEMPVVQLVEVSWKVSWVSTHGVHSCHPHGCLLVLVLLLLLGMVVAQGSLVQVVGGWWGLLYLGLSSIAVVTVATVFAFCLEFRLDFNLLSIVRLWCQSGDSCGWLQLLF